MSAFAWAGFWNVLVESGSAGPVIWAQSGTTGSWVVQLGMVLLGFAAIAGLMCWLSLRFIPNNQIGVVERLWSPHGSVSEGRIIALDDEAGFQVDLLRGGIHFGLWRWQYRVHKGSLVTVPQGKIGYIYARDGEPLPPTQTLARIVECNNYQDAGTFLRGRPDTEPGQRGRQLAILREGVYAINPALFVVITEDSIYTLPSLLSTVEVQNVQKWRAELLDCDGDIAHKKTMLELLHDRDTIQNEARGELRRRFHEFDIECVDVLIGKPDTEERGGKIESLLEQLRTRQLSIEQLETYERQRAASEKLRMLNEAQAQAEMQTQLTNARVRADIAESEGAADLARARKQAEKQVVMAEADLAQARRKAEQTVVLAEADSRGAVLAGQGEAQRIGQVGQAQAEVLLQKINSYGNPRLYVLEQAAAQFAQSSQPLVPERVFLAAAGGTAPTTTNSPSDSPAGANLPGLAGLLLQLLIAEKSGLGVAPTEVGEQFRVNREPHREDLG